MKTGANVLSSAVLKVNYDCHRGTCQTCRVSILLIVLVDMYIIHVVGGKERGKMREVEIEREGGRERGREREGERERE